jgi:hypothetical protein
MGRIKNLFISNKVPASTSFKVDDLVINAKDGKVFIKTTDNRVICINTSSIEDDEGKALVTSEVTGSTLINLVSNGQGQISGTLGDGTFSVVDVGLEPGDNVTFANITSTGNITAAGDVVANRYVVSSSVSHIIQSFSSGSTIFGDTINDTHQFTGSISVSASTFTVGGTSTFKDNVTLNGSTTTIGDAESDRIEANAAFASRIKALSHITASGNISSSGDLSIFGEVVHLEGTDPRLKLKAKGANHPGIEWHEDSTRKWVIYNDPDENDNLTIKNDSTELIKISQSGDLLIPSKIIHSGDSDTRILFTDDDINITVGGVNMVDFTEGGTDEITFNEAGADLDVRIEGDTDTDLLFTNAGTDRVGVGTNSPSSKLEVDGDITSTHITSSGNISASGTVTMLTASIGGGIFTSASLAAGGGGGGGTTTNALTVDNATLQLNSGTTFDGSAARTISIKDGGVDSDALAANIIVTQLTASAISASGTITANSFTGNGLSIDGPSNSHIEVGEYKVGFDALDNNTLRITGSGLIISGAMATNHHNMLKIGNVELLDLNTAVSTNEFLIHNVASLKITSGSDGGDVAHSTNEIFVHNGHEFFLCKGGEGTSNATIKSTGTTTTLTDTTVQINANNLSIKALNATPSYIMGFEGNPNSTPSIAKSIIASNIFPALGGAVTASAVSSSGNIIGELTGIGGAVTGINSILATDLKLGEDAQTKIDFETANEIHFDVNNVELLNLTGAKISGSGISTGSFGRVDATSLPNIGYANFTGSVGIGTTSPGQKLEVIGNISSSGDVAGNTITVAGTDFINLHSTGYRVNSGAGPLILFGNITASGDISSSGTITAATLDAAAVSDTLAAAIVAEIDNDEIPVAKLAEDSISGVTLGGNLNNLTVDNATLQLNSGTTYNGSAARTISIKDGGVDSDALAADISVTSLTTTNITASGDISASGTIIANNIESTARTITYATTAGHYSGDVVSFGNGPGGTDGDIVQGELYYLSSSQNWEKTDADATGTATNMLGIAVADDTPTFLVKGIIANAVYAGFTTGAPLYVHTTAGDITGTAPSGTGDIVRIVGHSVNGTNRVIYFNPSNDFIVHA